MSNPVTTAAARFRYLGTSDDVTTCEKCHKDHLRSTVVIQPVDADGNDDGDAAYYGSTCGARALGVTGGGRKFLAAAQAAHQRTINEAAFARQLLDHYGLPWFGQASDALVAAAAVEYAAKHAAALWARDMTGAQWRDEVRQMLVFRQAQIADCARLAHSASTPADVAARASADQAGAELGQLGIPVTGIYTGAELDAATRAFGALYPAMERASLGFSDLRRMTREYIAQRRERVYRAAHLTAAA